MKILGLVLIIAGFAVLANKGYTYRKTTTLIDSGPVQASFQHDKHVYVEPLVGLIALAGGVVLLVQGKSKTV